MLVPEKILIIAGVLNLAYGCLFGFPYAFARMKAEFPSRYLQASHIGPLMQGTMLLALVVAFRYANLTEGIAYFAAYLLSGSSLFLALKDTVNWLQSVKDEFQEKPIAGRLLGTIGVTANIIGIAIIVIGVLLT
ncbi:hypothetical protein CH373_11015 [Leptospira perolatii]|uniref:DUF4149 domain-containing protein n=1 Tax=Leptospira perolatii TaxID=2023191 RepID=A0A2M9ZLY7_9LEPT|nr:hypothetical protein [Leptospira perolatii]PJZ69760.1 hypothetical protein CH360_09220 [Leptospira perolatii]PJZ73025.1 hypothetical protein CH373_11015 [Leptospira perolatii]